MYAFGMPKKDWQQRLDGYKARTVTDTKILQGDDPDKRNSNSASISLNYSHFRVLHTLTVLTFFVCLDSKNKN